MCTGDAPAPLGDGVVMWAEHDITAYKHTSDNWSPSFALYSNVAEDGPSKCEDRLVRVHLMWDDTMAKIVVSGSDDACMEKYYDSPEVGLVNFDAILSLADVTKDVLSKMGLVEA